LAKNSKSAPKCLQEDILNMLIVSESIQCVDGKYIFLDGFNNYKDFHFERMKISARHWSYGAICHDNDRKFQDHQSQQVQ